MGVAADGAGAVRVSPSGPNLAVVAHSAPLSVVLAEIGRHSGTKVTYEGVAPAAPLTCDFVAATPAEAFQRALEGFGLSYALYGGTPGVPGILFVFAPSGVPTGAPTRVATSPPAVPADSLDEEERLPLAIPPASGAVPLSFLRQGLAEPASEGADDRERPSGEAEKVQTPQMPSRTIEPLQMPSVPAQGQAGDGDRSPIGQPGRPGRPRQQD